MPKSFCVGVKLNSADYMKENDVSDMLEQVRLLQQEQIDYLNLSGGSFENPQVGFFRRHTLSFIRKTS